MKFNTLRSSHLTYPSQRFGTCGRAARYPVRFIIRAKCVEGTDEQTVRQCSTFIFWCVPTVNRFTESLTELVMRSKEPDCSHWTTDLGDLLYEQSETF